MARLLVENLSHRFFWKAVLENVNFELESGEVLCLLGPSGCGKSTLLNFIAGLLVPWKGKIQNDFQNPSLVFQAPRLLPWLLTWENIALGLKARGVSKKERFEKSVIFGKKMGLTVDDLHQYPSALSGGMQSRVALCRAFVVQPDLLLLDEPFSALDWSLKQELYTLLEMEQSSAHFAALMITHDPLEALRLADRILMMQKKDESPAKIAQEWRIPTPKNERCRAWLSQKSTAFLDEVAALF